MPEGCELATWVATHVPEDYVCAFLERLLEYLDEYPDGPDVEQTVQFLECMQGVLE